MIPFFNLNFDCCLLAEFFSYYSLVVMLCQNMSTFELGNMLFRKCYGSSIPRFVMLYRSVSEVIKSFVSWSKCFLNSAGLSLSHGCVFSWLCDERNAAVLLLKFTDVFVACSSCLKCSFTFSITSLCYSETLMMKLLFSYFKKLTTQLPFGVT